MAEKKSIKRRRPLLSRMLSEIGQGHATRQPLIEKIQASLKREVITYFTSTRHPTGISDADNDMIETMLQAAGRDFPLTLILNSPGGDALAAERIINTCRTYTGGDFEVIVPRIAKSAATMICMGARKIWMTETAELGPIDPQVRIAKEHSYEYRGAYYLVDTYRKLFDRAVKTKGNIHPFLQQLGRYDSRDIREYENALDLAEDIAIKSLKTGMMSTVTERMIKKRIKPFCDPSQFTKTHGRPIYYEEAKKAGLNVELINVHSERWEILWELYLRTDRLVNSDMAAKSCESAYDSFQVAPPQRD